ncbi:L-asparaginase-like isoform X2 [Pomacea canaliculata]|uniref:L-asparaginase-like isoform X2 n=1 Tax=Pomacea canaliculata TaxID=400727 RepID=UPI000D72C997|nr:L-asparaginase-like isoform X2 [Pomacea canaliculata]
MDIADKKSTLWHQKSLEEQASRLETQSSLSQTSDMIARVLVIYTGGTIGMINKDGAYVPEAKCLVTKLRSLSIFHDEDFVLGHLSPENQKIFLALPKLVKEKRRIVYKVIEFEPLLDSSNMTGNDWIKIAECIQKHYDKYDGFVVLHGTDTMAYTASALSFMCEHLGKPIILTGSQIPIFEVRSDGRDNFLSSLIIAGTYPIPEVLLCFNEKVYRGNRCVKSDNSSFSAFSSPNMPPLVRLEIDIFVDWPAVFYTGETEKFRIHTNMCQNVGILRLFPGITAQTVRAFMQPPMQGIILQTYGAGNAPTNRADLLDVLEEACKWGVLIVNITQCSRGNVNAAYATGVALQKAGVILGGDMTTEAALAKLSYVLGKGDWSMEKRKKMLGQNLRGEMTTVAQETLSFMDHDLIESVAQTLHLSTHEEVNKLKDALFPNLMCAAAKNSDIPALEKLIEAGSHLSAPNQDGRTALHVACHSGDLRLVQFLLNNGASVHVRDYRGDSPLIDAIHAKNLDIIYLLVQTGAVIPWSKSAIALHLCSAAALNDLNTIKAWHAAGADLNSFDYDYRTALHVAVTSNRKDVAEFLMKNGAHCNLQDVFGLTALTIAQKLGYTELLSILNPDGHLCVEPIENLLSCNHTSSL